MSIYQVPANTNIEETAQRTDVLHFMDVTDVSTPATEGDTVWRQLGAGWMDMTENPAAQTKERKFINEKSSRKNITSYSPSFAFEVLLMHHDPAVRKVYDIYTHRKTGTNAVVTVVTVDKFDTPVNGAYPSRLGRYAVEVSSCDDDDDMIIKGNLNGQGDEEMGYFNPTTGVWTSSAPAAANNPPPPSGSDPNED